MTVYGNKFVRQFYAPSGTVGKSLFVNFGQTVGQDDGLQFFAFLKSSFADKYRALTYFGMSYGLVVYSPKVFSPGTVIVNRAAAGVPEYRADCIRI